MIRPVTPADVPGMIALFRRSVREVACRDYSPAQTAAWAPDIIPAQPWLDDYASRTAWIAEVDGALAGFTDLDDHGDAGGHIDKLFVSPDHQHRGIAKALIATAEAAARGRGLMRLYTEASLTARPFFESAGFSVITRQTVHVRGLDFINFRMAKELR